jgi:hypothetical protein
MAFGGKLKAFVQRCVNVLGYRIEKVKDAVKAPIDVLDLLLTKVSQSGRISSLSRSGLTTC